jgi:hypothetical protein
MEGRAQREAAAIAAEAAAMRVGIRIRMQLALRQWQDGAYASFQEKQR